MTDFNSLLKNEESAVFSLRELYRSYGYLPYKMSKFEEYDLYVRNKDFLVSDSIITFNDTNGKLLALKPDVTLSIVKNCGFEKGCTQKLFYNENVYRVSQGTHAYKEIMQTGLECIGDVDVFDIEKSSPTVNFPMPEVKNPDYIYKGAFSSVNIKSPIETIYLDSYYVNDYTGEPFAEQITLYRSARDTSACSYDKPKGATEALIPVTGEELVKANKEN